MPLSYLRLWKGSPSEREEPIVITLPEAPQAPLGKLRLSQIGEHRHVKG